ncbi:MAG: protein kinase [Bryobacterales bacterium]|nr:protein kinase [Bryobacterales bacterium]
MTPESTIAHYRIVSKIGEGGMGAVYRATDTKLARDVAIKVLPDAFAHDADRLARFVREAQVLASLNHPNIAAIYGIEERAIVMELVEGPALADRIAQGALPLDEALPIARQIAKALEAAHEKGVIHRDLKPANVKVTPDGKVKVLDFGLAKLADPSDSTKDAANATTVVRGNSPTLAGMILGTAEYMSPEQAAGKAVDKRSDIWSFGVVLWEMLSGGRLFAGETISHTLADVLRAPIDVSKLPASTPLPIVELVRRCLERDPKRRLRDIGEARIAIETYLADPASDASGTVMPPAVAPRMRLWPWVAAALMGVSLAAVSVVHLREKLPEPVVIRFQIPAPEKTVYSESTSSGMAISPDGTRLAFIAASEGRRMLWVRSLDSLTAQRLEGTDEASFPFWSPDSRFLAFFVPGKLRTVEASGGPPQTVCEVPNTGVGGSWNRDGVIVFGTNSSGLFRVPHSGGSAVPLTTRDTTRGEIFHAQPWFLPDGRRFLFLVNSSTPENSGIYLASLEGKERKRLVAPVQGAAYVPSSSSGGNGYLLFLRDGTLMALPLNARSFDPAGEALPVAEQVGFFISNPYFSVSSDRVLVYRVRGAAGSTRLEWFDREDKGLGAVGAPGDYRGLALSPDGGRVAVSRLDAGGALNSDIWLLDVARGIPTRFSFNPGEDYDPVWSPDGNRVVFASLSGVSDLYQKSSGGAGNEEPLLKSNLSKRPFDWSTDGRFLLYSVDDPKTKSDLWILPDPTGTTGTRKPRPLLVTPYNETQGQFFPALSGPPKWVAYCSDESGRYEVYV